MTSQSLFTQVQQTIWSGRVPIEIKLSKIDSRNYDQTPDFITFAYRISYLPLLLPRLLQFFRPWLIDSSLSSSDGWFSFDNVPLKWHYPIGLLFDLYSGVKEELIPNDVETDNENTQQLPWKIILNFSSWPKDDLIQMDQNFLNLKDFFENSLKEAAYIRHSTSKVIMSMSKEDTNLLWESVEKANANLFRQSISKLINPRDRSLLNIPIRIFVPKIIEENFENTKIKIGNFRVMQPLVPPSLSNRKPQTIGTALNAILPNIFTSSRSPLIAYPFLHGSILPMNTNLKDLAEYASYADGYLYIVIGMIRE